MSARGNSPLTAQARAPVRTCIGCGTRRPQPQLLRLCLRADGSCGTGPGAGRGAYVCGAGCFKAAVKKKALARAFRGQLKGLDVSALEAALAAKS